MGKSTWYQGRIQGGGHARCMLPLKIGKNKIFWHNIVIFHTKYPKNVRASLRSVHFFKVRPPPNLKSWICPWVPPLIEWPDLYMCQNQTGNIAIYTRLLFEWWKKYNRDSCNLPRISPVLIMITCCSQKITKNALVWDSWLFGWDLSK